jgi:outer membrane protein assembly factor BamD (BamD/ComL family)
MSMVRTATLPNGWRLAAIATAVAAAFALHPATSPVLIPVAQAQQTVRAEIGKPLQQARDLIKANKHKEALAKLREVEAVPNRTAEENFLIEQMRASAASQAGDNEQAIKSFTFLINSGRLNEADTGRYAAGLAGLHYRQRDYKAAATWAERALKANPNDGAMRSLLVQSYFQAGDMAAAQREALAEIQAAEKAGRTPPEEQLQLLANIASRNPSDRRAYVNSLERLVSYYPKREYWADLLRRIESQPGWSNRLTVDLYRLRAATRTLTSAADYSEYAQLALQEQQAGEAKRILDEGFAAGILGKGAEAERQQRLLALAGQRAADAPKALAEAETQAAAAKDGNDLVRIGFGYSGLGQHDKGVALMQQGIAKGGLKRKDDATLHLGIALHRAGQKQRAAQVLRTVGGTDGTADLARLWMKVP